MAAPQSDPVTLSAFEISERLTIIKVYKIILTFTKRNIIKSYLKNIKFLFQMDTNLCLI